MPFLEHIDAVTVSRLAAPSTEVAPRHSRSRSLLAAKPAPSLAVFSPWLRQNDVWHGPKSEAATCCALPESPLLTIFTQAHPQALKEPVEPATVVVSSTGQI